MVTKEPQHATVIEPNISFDTYMAEYAANAYEWVAGKVIPMSPIHERHDELTRYSATLFNAYFEQHPIGRIRQAPFVMRLPDANTAREPDIQIVLERSYDRLTPTYMDGPADICIEVVSRESMERDHGIKFAEYEKAGVPEYWILDPIHFDTRFYHLNEDGIYQPQRLDANGHYTTPLLPGLYLDVNILWETNLPGPAAIAQAVSAMLDE